MACKVPYMTVDAFTGSNRILIDNTDADDDVMSVIDRFDRDDERCDYQRRLAESTMSGCVLDDLDSIDDLIAF